VEPSSPPAAEPGHVLIAEDEGINRIYLQSILEGEGWTVDSVADGEEVVKAFGRRRYDLVLMDISMPKLNGFEASRRLRRAEAESGAKRTPIIALTAHAYEQDKAECREAGMEGFVSKPFHEQELWNEIHRLLRTAETE